MTAVLTAEVFKHMDLKNRLIRLREFYLSETVPLDFEELLVTTGADALEEMNRLGDDIRTKQADLSKLQVDARELEEENTRLRHTLHEMTVSLARIEGYRDRVQEFDPVPEKRAYADQVHPPRQVVDGYAEGATRSSINAGWSTPWYARRRA